MGAYFPSSASSAGGGSSSSSLADDEGYAISLWLRVDPSTRGFAYAVTDAYEDVETHAVPTLDRLAEIIAGGGDGGSSRWFPDTYSVYHSLYVDGPSRSLSFAYASAPPTAAAHADDNNTNTNAGTVTVLSFDLTTMGAEHLFNGQWHHTALLLLVRNGRARAQLAIDGQSSDYDPDWGRCVSDFPKPIAAAPTAALSVNTTRVGNAQSNRVASGGMLVVGYFNGGVGMLRAHPRRVSATDLLPYGTQTMRDANSFPRAATLGMGCALITFAAVLLIACAVVGCRDLKQMRAAASAASYSELSNRLFAHLCAATDHEQQSRLDALAAKKGLPNSKAATTERAFIAVLCYRPIRLYLAALMDEVEGQVAGGAPEKGRAVLTLLYQLKTRSPGAVNVSDGMWNCIAQADANSPADAARDVQCCGGADHFKRALAAERARRRAAFVEEFGASSDVFDSAGGDGMWMSSEDSNSSDDNESDRYLSSGAHRHDSSSFSGDDEMRPIVRWHDNRKRSMDGSRRGAISADAEASKSDHTITIGKVGVSVPVATGGDAAAASASIPPPPAIVNVSPIASIAAPFASALQSVSVWAASLTLPFAGLFSFLSLELSSVFAGLPAISTPIIQVAAAIAILSLVVYLEDRFLGRS